MGALQGGRFRRRIRIVCRHGCVKAKRQYRRIAGACSRVGGRQTVECVQRVAAPTDARPCPRLASGTGGEGRWRLYPVDISDELLCNPEEQQPGQPGGSDWTFYNRQEEQPLRFILRAVPSYGNTRGMVKRPTFYAGGSYMTFETEIGAGQYLVCESDRIGRVYDANWNLLKTVEAVSEAPLLKRGGQTVSFSCRFEGDPKPRVSVKLFTRGVPEVVAARPGE